MPTVHLLGGYGMTGIRLARLLLESSDVRLILSGRTPARAKQAAAELNRTYPGIPFSQSACELVAEFRQF